MPTGQEDSVDHTLGAEDFFLWKTSHLLCGWFGEFSGEAGDFPLKDLTWKTTVFGSVSFNYTCFTLPETNSSHLEMDGWNTSFLLGWPIFRCYVSYREGTLFLLFKIYLI